MASITGLKQFFNIPKQLMTKIPIYTVWINHVKVRSFVLQFKFFKTALG